MPDRNSNLINDDPRGTFWNCPWGELPEIMPFQFDRSKMIYSNDVKEEKKTEEPVIVKENQRQKFLKKIKKKHFFLHVQILIQSSEWAHLLMRNA